MAIGGCPSAAPRRESLRASGPGARLSGSAADDQQTDDEDEDDELEGDSYGVLETALQTGVADGYPYGEREQPGDHQEHAKSGRDEAAHNSRSAQEQERNAEQDAGGADEWLTPSRFPPSERRSGLCRDRLPR
jgi:hypothetical protein